MPVSGFIPFRTLAVIGLGLIGGSFAMDIRRLGLAERVIGYENNSEYRKLILTQNFVDYLGDKPDKELSKAELILLAVNINLVSFSIFMNDLTGQIFTLFILTVAAAEAAIGLAIIVVYYRNSGTIRVEEIDKLKG